MARRDAIDEDGGALDPALTQKKRARRRLVGALVLGLAAAIVLPLVLDSEPRQAITDVQIEIPPRETPLPPRADDSVRPAEDPAVAPPPPAAAPATETPKPASEKVPEKVPEKASEKASERAPAPRSKTPPKTAEQPKPEASAPASRAPAPAPSAAPAAVDARFVLQVGAFANPGSARAQADKARKAGVRVYTETVQTAQGERTRVRVGPFASREAADQARAKLKAVGVESAVVPL
ncbi:MAG TPA: SPOR domain-containing protein [Burkholderiaceae bacterium]|jgi:DedD protein|nr:SPOR domain-containing protein [Burkholderiaceae bacterium]